MANPQPQTKEKKTPWTIIYLVTGGTDAVQIFIDFLPVVGYIINEIADLFLGIIFGLWFWSMGLLDMFSFIAFIAAIVGKEGSLGAAPAWIAVAGLVHFNKLRQDAMKSSMGPIPTSGAKNHGGTRLPQRSSPLNSDGVRAPRKV